jgi:hypothetical protein
MKKIPVLFGQQVKQTSHPGDGEGPKRRLL